VQRAAQADDDGYYGFGDVPPGHYLITAVAPGYALGAAGQRTASDVPRSFELGKRETRAADVHLTPLGRISGRIVDEAGRPVANVQVQAIRRRPRLTDERAAALGGVTDSNGMFTIGGLTPGSYFVIATERAARVMPLAQSGSSPPFVPASMTYYPGTPVPSAAQTVRVELGAESSGVSFAVQPSRLARIRGVIVDSKGRPAADAVVMLTNAASDVPVPLSLSFAFSEVDGDGGFSLTNVPPGVFSLDVRSRSVFEAIARTGGGGIGQVRASPEFASVLLHVTGEDVDNLAIRTDRGFTASGRVVVEGQGPAPESLRVSATHAGDVSQHSRWVLSGESGVQPDGSFAIPKLLGPQILRVSRLTSGWGVKRVRIGAIDVTDEGIDVALDVSGVDIVVARLSEVSGLVTDRRGVPVASATVIVFSEDRRYWTLPFTRFVKPVLSASNGTFAVSGLPAGRYYAAVVPVMVEDTLADPDDLEALLARASRFLLGEGERRSLDLRLE
jgi:hypothetical protein